MRSTRKNPVYKQRWCIEALKRARCREYIGIDREAGTVGQAVKAAKENPLTPAP